MAPSSNQRPVADTVPVSTTSRGSWPAEALEQAVALQRNLTIGDRDWHALKRQKPRRAAEQISAALVQLLSSDDPAAAQPSEARRQAIALLEHSLAWLKGDLSDPGCPSHRR
jgi:hypothetical protein